MSITSSRRLPAVLAVGVLSAALALTGCSNSDDTQGGATTDSATHTVEADNGTVEVSVDPQRIVTIGPTAPLIDMGGEPVGVSTISETILELLPEDQQETYAAATHLASSADEVDIEQVASLNPDLILVQTTDAEFEQIADQLEAIAPTLFWKLSAEWKVQADQMAEAANLTGVLTGLKAEFDEKIANIQETYRDLIAETSFVNVDRYASSDPGTFVISDIGCVKIAMADVGMNFPEAAEGEDPLAWTVLPFEQLTKLSEYDAITYPVEADGNPTTAFEPAVETNTWKALPAVKSGQTLGLTCRGNNSYGAVLYYLDSLDSALASLPAKE